MAACFQALLVDLDERYRNQEHGRNADASDRDLNSGVQRLRKAIERPARNLTS